MHKFLPSSSSISFSSATQRCWKHVRTPELIYSQRHKFHSSILQYIYFNTKIPLSKNLLDTNETNENNNSNQERLLSYTPSATMPRSKLPQDQKFEMFLESIRKQNALSAMEEEELRYETEIVEVAKERNQKQIDGMIARNQVSALTTSSKIIKEWEPIFVAKIREFQQPGFLQQQHNNSFQIGKFLMNLDASRIAVITISTAISQLYNSLNGVSFLTLSLRVGEAIRSQLAQDKLKREAPNLLPYYNTIHRLKRYSDEEWQKDVCIKVGSFLLGHLVEIAKIPGIKDSNVTLIPAFCHSLSRVENTKQVGMLSMSEELRTLIESGNNDRVIFDLKYLPMLIPPQEWSKPNNGGYKLHEVLVMRTKGPALQKQVLKDAYLDEIFDGLNVLNHTKWRVNSKIFEVAKQVWDNGGGIAGIPSRKNFEIPAKPNTTNPDQIKKYLQTTNKIKTENANLHSLRCDLLLKFGVAEKFDGKAFYFPHNIDFRGRAYPIPPHLNHLGCDLNRGLLVFDNKKPIGQKGIFWLKIHLANLCGKDKLSFEDRVKYVDDNLNQIFESAANPLGSNNPFWLQSETPWQTLAACDELAQCLQSSNPAAFESCVPVQMDGSCNGLQHFAALGRDSLGALHVNLLPTEKPMDVYTGVLNVVLKHIEQDAANGNKCAQALVGKVVRSTIKQTVMTSVYGVTFIGAREQIQRRLKERKDMDDDTIFMCASYLAKITLKSLGQVFRGAKDIMEWLNDVAHLVSSEDEPVMWITPLGLPVVQPYHAIKRTQIKTLLQTISTVDVQDQAPVSKPRQKSAFPPNYVHSLDASHMLLTARACKAVGLDFASVHDSFWTHAGDVERMNQIIREQFVFLHSQPLLETLLESLQQIYPHIEFPALPKKGTLDLNRVKDSFYFFD